MKQKFEEGSKCKP